MRRKDSVSEYVNEDYYTRQLTRMREDVKELEFKETAQPKQDPKMRKVKSEVIFDIKNYDTVEDAKRAALASLSTQKRGKINKLGVIAQYPYFAKDQPFMKPAAKATDADKMFLYMYTQNLANTKIAQIDPKNLYSYRQQK